MMYGSLRRRMLAALGFAAALFTASALAQDGADAHDVVEDATGQVMAVVVAARDYVDEDPERYYRELQAVLDDLVDFNGFSRAVMGPYASGKRYRSLDEAGRRQLRRQLDEFTGVMRTSLVRTYGKGLIAFGGSRTEVSRSADGDGDSAGDRARVRQLIHGDDPEPYTIEYVMHRDREGRWRLRNLVVESINLGAIYRNQFQAAAKDSGGDIDAVIAGWATPAGADALGQSE